MHGRGPAGFSRSKDSSFFGNGSVQDQVEKCGRRPQRRRRGMRIDDDFISGNLASWYKELITIYLRLALGIGFLSAVADRFGWWGPPGTPNVAWGTFHNFLTYTAKLNPWFSGSWIRAIGWTATVCEACFGAMLVIGYRTRAASVGSGLLTLAFAIGMVRHWHPCATQLFGICGIRRRLPAGRRGNVPAKSRRLGRGNAAACRGKNR